jgi:AAA family ATP:ADP antiporter
MFGVFVVAQFWTFCADVYTDERGKRMLPFIAIGATSGAAAGSWMVDQLVKSGLVPTEALLLVAIAPLIVSIILVRKVEQREGQHAGPVEEVRRRSRPVSGVAQNLCCSASFCCWQPW